MATQWCPCFRRRKLKLYSCPHITQLIIDKLRFETKGTKNPIREQKYYFTTKLLQKMHSGRLEKVHEWSGRKSEHVQRVILQQGNCNTGSGKIIIENHNMLFNAKPQGRDRQDLALPLTQASLAFGITLHSSSFLFLTLNNFLKVTKIQLIVLQL